MGALKINERDWEGGINEEKARTEKMPYVLLGVPPWETGYLISASIHSQFSQWFEGPFRN